MFIHAAIDQTRLPRDLWATSFVAANDSLAYSDRFQAGTSIFVEGDTVDEVYELVSGVVRLSRSAPNGRREILGFVFSGQVFTSAGFAGGDAGAATCRADAISAIRVASYQRRNIDRIVRGRPDLGRAMIASSSWSLYLAQQHQFLRGRMSAEERVAWFLLLMARQQDVADAAPLRLPMSWLDIADYLGLTIETLSRAFSNLHNAGLIEVRGPAKVLIGDWNGLRKAASCALQVSSSMYG